NGFEVGRWTRRSGGAEEFVYKEQWLNRKTAIPISLSMPLSTEPYTGDVVWNYFDNLLPDNAEIRTRLQGRLGTRSTRPFDLLASMGGDCVGAIQIYPASEAVPDVRSVTATPMDDVGIGEMLRSYLAKPLGISNDDEFRISIAGAQEKTALLWHQNGWHRPSGATPTSHIFKLPIGPLASGIDLTGSVENEWLCLKIAAELGLPVACAEMHTFDGARALAVKRFDREWSGDGSWLIRKPQEDVCQALGVSPGSKYENEGGPGIPAVLDLLQQTIDPTRDQRTFFRAIVVFWLLAATDGHAKNFSLLLHQGGRCELAPLYDILSAYPAVADGQVRADKLPVAMAVSDKNRNYKWHKIRPRHLMATAKSARFPEQDAREIIEDVVARVPSVLVAVRKQLPDDFPRRIADAILNGVEQACQEAATCQRLRSLDAS
ncbi:UNVERIFIED_CONTAM: hypothetical protein GTU68_021676, partial [Idotea baltica]|nr:hypothetical protein [Idotea baltica]